MQRILLIEDDPLMAQLEDCFLSKAGFAVEKVQTREEAARAIRESRPDLIFSDLQLATGTPYDTIRFLSDISSSIPVVICSGAFAASTDNKLASACLSAGFLATIDKFEVSSPDLRIKILDALDKFQDRSETVL